MFDMMLKQGHDYVLSEKETFMIRLDSTNCRKMTGIKLMQVKVYGKDVSSSIIRQSTSKPFNYIVPKDNPFSYSAPIVGETIHQWLKVTFYFLNHCHWRSYNKCRSYTTTSPSKSTCRA